MNNQWIALPISPIVTGKRISHQPHGVSIYLLPAVITPAMEQMQCHAGLDPVSSYSGRRTRRYDDFYCRQSNKR